MSDAIVAPAPVQKRSSGSSTAGKAPQRRATRTRGGWDSVWMIVLIWALSGNPVFSSTPLFKPLCVICALVQTGAVLARGRRVPRRFFWILGGFAIICLIQAKSTGYYSPVTVFGFFSKLIIAATAALLIKNFPKTYVQVMYWTACISLPVYLLLVLTQGGLADVLEPIALNVPNPHILIHSFHPRHLTQNNSYFWEPGVFAGYLVLALMFLAATRKQFSPGRYRWILAVLLLAMLTTFSTGGYLMTPLALIFHGQHIAKHPVVRWGFAAFVVLGFILLFSRAEFLQEKIMAQIDATQAQRDDVAWESTRFGSMLADWDQIQQHPLFGWGPNPEARFQFVRSVEEASQEGNGLSDFIASFGLCGLLLYIYSVWTGLGEVFWSRRAAALATLVVMLALNEEPFLNFPLFMCLMFLVGAAPVGKRAGVKRVRAASFSVQVAQP